MNSNSLNVAILGGGNMATKHATAVRLQPGARLVAVADPYLSAEEIHRRFGADVEAFTDAEQLLRTMHPHIVHIVTPPDTHHSLARLCLEHGASVYVEKPFALTFAEAREILDLAASKGLKACAAHQVLFQRAGRRYREHLPVIGKVIHAESYFSFKPVRKRQGSATLTSPVEQLIDILPHPVYLLLDALGVEEHTPELTAFDVSPAGEVRAVIRQGDTLATLVVSLRARPVESYLRVVGTNGSVTAEFILGAIVSHYGPGASAPAVVSRPFSNAWQTWWKSLAGLWRLVFRRQKSYPGLGELLTGFYTAVRGEGPPPITPRAILATVQLCEQISARMRADERVADEAAERSLTAETARLAPPVAGRGCVVVTGGSGFLGRKVVRELRTSGWPVRVLGRAVPGARDRVPGVEYRRCDLGAAVPPEVLAGAHAVVHLAAETAGDRAAHERNSVVATRNLVDAMERAGVKLLINAGSVAVLRPQGSRELAEDSPTDRGREERGPYVWAKAEAEALAIEAAARGAVQVRTVRLGPLVDYGAFTSPGRLGREVARLYVAMGTRGNPLSVCDVQTAAEVFRYYVENFEAAPAMVNLVEVPAPTRGELAQRLRAGRPDLKFFWMPFVVLRFLGLLAIGLLRLMGKKPIDLYSAFKSERYRGDVAQRVIAAARAPRAPY
jgi:predicted dehydrogenase/nucleoside-diphosphate-sugar epimerase